VGIRHEYIHIHTLRTVLPSLTTASTSNLESRIPGAGLTGEVFAHNSQIPILSLKYNVIGFFLFVGREILEASATEGE
jgi:hypothetical protein